MPGGPIIIIDPDDPKIVSNYSDEETAAHLRAAADALETGSAMRTEHEDDRS